MKRGQVGRICGRSRWTVKVGPQVSQVSHGESATRAAHNRSSFSSLTRADEKMDVR